MIKVKYDFGSFSIDTGELITTEQPLKPIYKAMDKTVYPEQGEPDFVLAERFMGLLGMGEIIVKVVEQSNPETTY